MVQRAILFRSREPRVVGTGVEEFRRVARASTALFGTVAIISFLFKLEVARGYLAVALPLGLMGLLLTRWLWRRWLVKQRSEGRFVSTVVVVGSHSAAAAMAEEFERGEERAIASLECVFLVGEPEKAILSMSTAIRFRFLVMRRPSSMR